MMAPAALDRRSVEDRNLLDLARLTVAAALARTESRGAHSRSDIPETRPGLARPIVSAMRPSSSAFAPGSGAPAATRIDHIDQSAARETAEVCDAVRSIEPSDPSDTEKTSAC
jgi:L-aspartate oxidase